MPTELMLPQYDSQKALRRDHLQRMRQEYAYSLTYNGNIATIDNLPACEKAGAYYRLKMLANVSALIPSLPVVLYKFIRFGLLRKPFTQFRDYNFFPLSPIPDRALLTDLWNDIYFARQCVAGANPVMLQGVTRDNLLPSSFRVEEARLPISRQEFDASLNDNRLYVTNYQMLAPVVENAGEVGGHKKYITAPIALFQLQDDGNLRPLAIQLDVNRNTSADNPVITPDDNQQWRLARTCVQAADGAVHELWTHATQIHYVMESVILATYRQMGPTHPLLVLLDPHLQYTLNVNVHPLYEPGKDGKVPGYGKMFPGDNRTLVSFMAEGMRNFRFRETALPNDLRRRNVEDPRLDYPFRDDGLPIWDAIQEFALNYVKIYYRNDEDVVGDYELQDWAREIAGPRNEGYCGIGDFPQSFTTIEELAAVIGQIIFTATARHSAIHYPQYQYGEYVPNMPLSLYHPSSPIPKQDSAQEELLKFFPPFKTAFMQSAIYYAVNFRVNRIGEYDPKSFDPRALPVITAYQAELERISAAYNEKYRDKTMKYPYMNPQNIPNSVTV